LAFSHPVSTSPQETSAAAARIPILFMSSSPSPGYVVRYWKNVTLPAATFE
jgi:hypothetical protein